MTNKEMEFELIENSKITKYKYFGETRSMGGMNLGIDVNYPDEMNKEGWHDRLIKESECMEAATLGYLFHVKESYGDIDEIVSSQLFSDFIKKYMADGYFSEPYFIDGEFGRFNGQGDGILGLGYPDNYDEFLEDSKDGVLSWDKERIKIKLLNINDRPCFPRIGFDEIRKKIFINVALEDEFKSQLEVIIELFNTDSNL